MSSSHAFISNLHILPPNDVTTFLSVLKWSNFWSGSHIIWNQNRQKFQVTKSIWKLLKFACVIYGWIVYLSFLAGVMLHKAIWDGRSLHEYQRILLLFMGGLVPAIVLYAIVTREKEICVWVNGGLRLVFDFEAKYGNLTPFKISGLSHKLSNALSILLPGVKFYGITTFMFTLYKPYMPFFIPAYIPNEFRHPIIIFGHSLVAMSYVFSVGGTIITITGIMLLFAIVFFHVHAEINLKNKKFWAQAHLRTPENLASTVKSLMILYDILNELSNSWLFPLQILVTRSVQLTNFLIIRHHHELNVLDLSLCCTYVIMFGGGWLILVHVGGYANRISDNALKSFRIFEEKGYFFTRHQRLLWRRVRKTLRPIAAKVGSLYVIKSKSALLLSSDYVRGSVRLLVAINRTNT